jgi:hypothetical protein
MKQKYKIILKIKSDKEVPDFGLGASILATQEVNLDIYTGEYHQIYLDKIADNLITEIIDIKFEKL